MTKDKDTLAAFAAICLPALFIDLYRDTLFNHVFLTSLQLICYLCLVHLPSCSKANHNQQQQQQHSSSTLAVVAKNQSHGKHRYSEKCQEIESTFMKLAATDALWNPTPLVSQSTPYPITIQSHHTKPFCFRIIFYIPTDPPTAFDLLADILKRPQWDELTESTRIIEHFEKGDAIHYIKMKPVFPTSARDSLVISRIVERDGGYLNVSQSIEDPRVPEHKGIVRMEAGIAGQLIREAPERGPRWSQCVQVADGDLKGWIPASVIKFIATQALPRSLNKVCKRLEERGSGSGSGSGSSGSGGKSELIKRLHRTAAVKEEEEQSTTQVVARKEEPRSSRWQWIKWLVGVIGPLVVALVIRVLVRKGRLRRLIR